MQRLGKYLNLFGDNVTTVCENLRRMIVIFPGLREQNSRPISLDHYSALMKLDDLGPGGLQLESTNYIIKT